MLWPIKCRAGSGQGSRGMRFQDGIWETVNGRKRPEKAERLGLQKGSSPGAQSFRAVRFPLIPARAEMTGRLHLPAR